DTNAILGFLDRPSTGASTAFTTAQGFYPYWLRLVRVGNLFTGSASYDGQNWTTVGSATIVMSGTIYVGLASCSTTNSTLLTASFSDVLLAIPPAAPSLLSGSVVSSSEIDLAWTDNSFNETGFELERSTDGVNFTQFAVVPPDFTHYSDTGLAPGVSYSYRIRAANPGGDSPYSNIAPASLLAWLSGSTLNVQFDGTSVPIVIGAGGGAGSVTVTKNATTTTFTGVTSISALGTAAADALNVSGALATPISFSNGGGNDSVRLLSGANFTFAADLSPSTHNVAVTIDAG